MENRFKYIFLSVLLGLFSATFAQAAELDIDLEEESSTSSADIFDPKVERREVDVDAINTENWELGLHYGLISIEDFGTKEIASLSVSYHVTEDFFLSLNYGESEAGRTSFERLSGDIVLLTDEERQYTHYTMALGFNLLPGEGFMGRNIAFTSNFYFLAGLGATEFAGDTLSTVMLGGGYQMLFNDWLAMHISLKDYFYDIDIIGTSKTANDIEISTGFTVFF